MSGIKRDKRDRVFSDLIRERDGWNCQRCGTHYSEGRRQGLHCAHFHKRRNKGLRWDPMNADALCYGCHQYFEEHPNLHRQWKLARIGQDALDLLDLRAYKPTKFTPADLEWIHQDLKRQLAEVRERNENMMGAAS